MPKATASPPSPDLALPLEDFARLIGRSLPTVRKLVKDGMPTRGRQGRTHLVDVGPAVRWMLAQLEARAEARTSGPAQRTAEARARKAELDAEEQALKLAQKRGGLISREQVILEGQAFVKAWTAQVRGLPRRLRRAGIIQPEQEPAAAAECRQLLQDITTWKTPAAATQASTEEPTSDARE